MHLLLQAARCSLDILVPEVRYYSTSKQYSKLRGVLMGLLVGRKAARQTGRTVSLIATRLHA